MKALTGCFFKIDERGASAMLTLDNYDVQETRRLAREEARAEERHRADKAEMLLKSAIKLLLDQGNTITDVAAKMNITEQEIKEVLPELV